MLMQICTGFYQLSHTSPIPDRRCSNCSGLYLGLRPRGRQGNCKVNGTRRRHRSRPSATPPKLVRGEIFDLPKKGPEVYLFEVVRCLVEVRRIRAFVGRNWTDLGPNLVDRGPTLFEIRRRWPPTSVECGSNVFDAGANWPIRVESVPQTATLGPSPAEVEQCRHNFGKIRPGFGHAQAPLERCPGVARALHGSHTRAA